MKKEFRLKLKKISHEKTSIVVNVLILCLVIILGVFGLLQDELRTFQLFCLLPYIILYEVYSIAESLFRVNYEKLLLSPTGIEYHAFSYMVYSEWGDLNRIGNDPSYLRRKTECIVTKSNNVKNRIPFRWLFRMERTNCIPVSLFFENWRDSELGQQIKQYAPHLF
ncbi:MAG: hypothetical protein C4583_00400 [Anaerolineaceae bacterium]|nr:MAG: hypothetical protein C4583_00400 [Anaerolineaceae bacterium]